MSDYIQAAINAAISMKPTDFKDSINSAIHQKMNDAVFLKKMEVANQIFNNQEESTPIDSELNPEEENIDEEL